LALEGSQAIPLAMAMRVCAGRKHTLLCFGGKNVASIAAGYSHSFALVGDGELWAAGKNKYGELGIGSTEDQYSFVKVELGGKKVASIVAGASQSVVLMDDGLWAAGANGSGQLGIESASNQSSLVKVDLVDKEVTSVAAAGAWASTSVEDNGEVCFVGERSDDQLGLESVSSGSHAITSSALQTRHLPVEKRGDSASACADIKNPTARTHRVAVKLKFLEDTFRLRLPYNAESLSDATYEDFEAAIKATPHGSNYFKARYRDGENDLCTLCPASLTDFLETQTVDASGCVLLKLEIMQPALAYNAKTRADLGLASSENLNDAQSHDLSDDDTNILDGYDRMHLIDSLDDSTPVRKCLLPNTLLPISHLEYVTARRVKLGDKIQSSSGNLLDVAFVQIHEHVAHTLVTLRTAQAELTVTSDHRIVVLGADDKCKDVRAGDLKVGNYVFCGSRKQRLTKVVQHERTSDLVEIRFNPDEPVEARAAPRWGILAKGEEMPCTIQMLGPLGPWQVVPYNVNKTQKRAKSAER